MKWNTYQDMENRAYSNILTTLFPEQTKTIPRILIWSVIFLIDLTAVVAAGSHFGLLPGPGWGSVLVLASLFGLFWLQGYLWSTFMRLFR